MRRSAVLKSSFVVLMCLGGCAKMSAVDNSRLVLAPDSGKALVFIARAARPGSPTVGDGVEGISAIYADDQFVGLLAPDTHLAVQLAPGQHIFMVVGEKTNFLRAVAVGESPDFVRADLAPDRTYYIKVEPTSTLALESSFSMEAHNGQFTAHDLSAWTRTRQYVVNSRGAAWAEKRKHQISGLKNHFFPKWEAQIAHDKREAEKHTLRPDSGK